MAGRVSSPVVFIATRGWAVFALARDAGGFGGDGAGVSRTQSAIEPTVRSSSAFSSAAVPSFPSNATPNSATSAVAAPGARRSPMASNTGSPRWAGRGARLGGKSTSPPVTSSRKPCASADGETITSGSPAAYAVLMSREMHRGSRNRSRRRGRRAEAVPARATPSPRTRTRGCP